MIINRLFGLDFLRALAILFVFFGHWMAQCFPNAAEAMNAVFHVPDGVALFFCLSGYLIATSFLHHVSAPGKASFLHFWCRRAIRTIPPYIVAISLYNILVIAFKVEGLSVSSNNSYFFLQNLAWPIYGGYPESWSLSVEEWFYALLMALSSLSLVARRGSKCKSQDLAFAAFVLIAISFLYRVLFIAGSVPHVDSQEPGWVLGNYVINTVLGRLDAPGFGVLAAVVAFRYPNLWKSRAVMLGCLVAGILLIVALHQAYFSYPIAFDYFRRSMIGLGFVLLLPFFSQWATRKASLLRQMVSRLAASAFSIYLWHYSIGMLVLAPLVGQAMGLPSNLHWILYLAIGLGGAQIFYVLVERPFVQMKETVNYVFSPRSFQGAGDDSRPLALKRVETGQRLAKLSWRPLLLIVFSPGAYVVSLMIDDYLQNAANAAVAEKYAASEIRIGGVCDFEAPQKGNRGTVIAGWAALPSQHAVADVIFLQLDHPSSIRRIKTQRNERADVVEYFKDNALLMAGFNAVLEYKAGTKVKVLQASDGILYECEAEIVLQ